MDAVVDCGALGEAQNLAGGNPKRRVHSEADGLPVTSEASETLDRVRKVMVEMGPVVMQQTVAEKYSVEVLAWLIVELTKTVVSFDSRILAIERQGRSDFLSVAGAARASGMSLSTIKRAVRRGIPRSVKRGRRRFILRESFEVFLATQAFR